MPLVTYDDLKNEYIRVLTKRGMAAGSADKLATAFADMGNEGTYSHGINRFPVFIGQVDKGEIKLDVVPVKDKSIGVIEQWDCQFGPGPLNGIICSDRAMELARENGIGLVAMKNSNHWMRGGAYAIRMAREGFAAIAVTNSIAVMPAWGTTDHRVGTNPLIIAVPGNPPTLLDMSMSQYSYGRLEVARLAGQQLPVVGGYDKNGELTKDPEAINETKRLLPAGFWKGSALSIVLDMLVVGLTGGKSVPELTAQGGEYGISQILMAIDLSKTIDSNTYASKIKEIVEFTKAGEPAWEGAQVQIPGEEIEVFLNKHKEMGGIPVDDSIWAKITAL